MLKFEIVPVVKRRDLGNLLIKEGIAAEDVACFFWESEYVEDSYRKLCFRINGHLIQFDEDSYGDKEVARVVNLIYKILDKVIPSQFDYILVDVLL